MCPLQLWLMIVELMRTNLQVGNTIRSFYILSWHACFISESRCVQRFTW